MTAFERIERISRMAQRFRKAASLPDIRENFAGYYSFPRASYTWSSFAFGLLLLELEPERDWHLVNGRKGSAIDGHDWLEDGRLAVDITADQFVGEQFYVGLAPSPCARQWPSKRRIELSDAAELQVKALAAIRAFM